MKLGCLFAFLTFVGVVLVSSFLAFLVDLIPGINANYEGFGAIGGYIFWLCLGPLAFIYGFREQAKQDRENKLKNAKPENLRPLNLTNVLKATSPGDTPPKVNPNPDSAEKS